MPRNVHFDCSCEENPAAANLPTRSSLLFTYRRDVGSGEGSDEGAEGGEGGVEETKGGEAEAAAAAASAVVATEPGLSFPKVLITVRSELLSGKHGYKRTFLPVETNNGNKVEEHEAEK